ncbi:MAG: hypothetical protein VX367_10095, partial [SAR324 cluster bacterium]|nr:hypothetical protein [SAR324 cluster bacterium]
MSFQKGIKFNNKVIRGCTATFHTATIQNGISNPRLHISTTRSRRSKLAFHRATTGYSCTDPVKMFAFRGRFEDMA